MTYAGIIFLSAFICVAVWVAIVIWKGNGSHAWLSSQFEWFKGFFEESAGQADKPSHKNLILLALTAIFAVAFMRTVVATAAAVVPDIPTGWLALFLGGLGIRGLQSVFETRARAAAGNTSVSTSTTSNVVSLPEAVLPAISTSTQTLTTTTTPAPAPAPAPTPTTLTDESQGESDEKGNH